MFDYLKADLKRLSPSQRLMMRTFLSGLLSQGFQAILVYRFFNWLHERRLPGQPLRFISERFIEITTGISIPACCRIGKGLRIHHFGGIIFHPSVEIGDNCTLYHGVTIGDRGGSGGAAKIGDDVLIGAGAKIIGEVTIGDRCVIGANTVVTKDMPSDTVAVGTSTQIKPRRVEVPMQSSMAAVPRVMDLRGTYKGGGGPDKTVLNSAAQHDPSRVHVLVTYLRQPWDDGFQIPEMAHRLGINYVDVIDAGMLDYRCLATLRRLLKAHHITVIHAHDDKSVLYAWLLKLLTPGLKIMYTCHSHSVHTRGAFTCHRDYLVSLIRQRVKIFLLRRFSKPLIAVSQDTRRRLINNGVAARDVTVLHNGVEAGVWRRDKARAVLREELGVPTGGLLVGTVARISYEKDLSTFYLVAKKVAQQVPCVTFVIVGDGYGDELAKAKDEVERGGMSDLIRFTGHRNDLLDVYVSFDVFLMTSVTEGMPNTLLEAMSLGVPSVATAVGGIPELLEEGRCGFLAPVGDAEALAGYVINLLKDPSLRAACAAASRERIEQTFSFARRVRVMEDYYAWFAGHSRLPEHGLPKPDAATLQ